MSLVIWTVFLACPCKKDTLRQDKVLHILSYSKLNQLKDGKIRSKKSKIQRQNSTKTKKGAKIILKKRNPYF